MEARWSMSAFCSGEGDRELVVHGERSTGCCNSSLPSAPWGPDLVDLARRLFRSDDSECGRKP